MAKVVGLVGSASGKIGNIVYAVTNGIQVARVYQPIVKNPKSSAQTRQRAKGNLVGRLSGITPKEAILGLGKNNRQRRAEFLKNGLVNATVQISDGVYTAKIEPSALKFSKGAVTPVIAFSGATINAGGTVVISYSRIQQSITEQWDKASGIFVAVAIDDVTGNYDFVEVKAWSKPNYPVNPETVLTETILVPTVTTHDVFIYFVPSEINTSKLSTVAAGLGISANEYAAALSLTDAAALSEYGNSLFIGEAIIA